MWIGFHKSSFWPKAKTLMPIRNKSCNIKRMNWRIGCSGYYYPEWKGIFYPPDLDRKAWFQHYCRHFNTIELNSTFYRFPRLEFLNNWYSNSPDDFVFSVKAPRDRKSTRL